jgi:cytochrome c peroxidase
VPLLGLLPLLGAPGAVAAGAQAWSWQLPPGFPTPWVPADNPMSAPKVALGRRLFCEPRLSVTGTESCASCHEPARAFTDGRASAVGARGAQTRHSAPTLANVAYEAAYTWSDPRVRTLEQQMREPLFNGHPVELGVGGHQRRLLALLSADGAYPRLFAAAFPGAAAPVSIDHVIKAIATFERTLISGRSAFDRYVFDDERAALSEGAKRGMALFYSPRAGCAQCHAGLNFTGPLRYVGHRPAGAWYANTGLYDRDGRGAYPAIDPGLTQYTRRDADMGRFRVPTLRNIALTAPYMHDGSIATLAEVIEHYDAGARGPLVDRRIRPLGLSAAEKSDLLAFLESLTDTQFVRAQRCD